MVDTYCACCINRPITISKGPRYGFNVPKCHLKTKSKYEHDKKCFSNSVKYFKNLRIV